MKSSTLTRLAIIALMALVLFQSEVGRWTESARASQGVNVKNATVSQMIVRHIVQRQLPAVVGLLTLKGDAAVSTAARFSSSSQLQVKKIDYDSRERILSPLAVAFDQPDGLNDFTIVSAGYVEFEIMGLTGEEQVMTRRLRLHDGIVFRFLNQDPKWCEALAGQQKEYASAFLEGLRDLREAPLDALADR